MSDMRAEDLPNCWDIMDCSEKTCRECPAYPDHGTECWKITGTRCAQGALVKASLSEKIVHCRNNCRYYREYVSKLYP